MAFLVINGPNGPLAFDDRGAHGSGVPRYYSRPGYERFSKPTVVGARYFPPEPERDEDDNPVPMTYGSLYTGGREAYQTKVYAAAKKDGSKLGFRKKDVDALKPKVVA